MRAASKVALELIIPLVGLVFFVLLPLAVASGR